MDTEEGIVSRIRNFINTGAARLAVVVLAVAAVAVAVTVAVRSPTDTEKRADDIRAKGLNVLYLCKACKATGEMHKAFDTPFPIKCPKCGKVKAVAAFKCVRCRRIIEAVDVPYFTCPHCGYTYDQRLLTPGGGAAAPPRP